MTRSNPEYWAELVRAHYTRDDQRFDIILSQVIASEARSGNVPLVERLRQLAQTYVSIESSGTIPPMTPPQEEPLVLEDQAEPLSLAELDQMYGQAIGEALNFDGSDQAMVSHFLFEFQRGSRIHRPDSSHPIHRFHTPHDCLEYAKELLLALRERKEQQ